MKKRDSIKTFFLLAEILLYAEISHAVDIYSGPQSFCYDDPSCGPKSSLWGGVCQTGKLQSPINIMTAPPDAIVDVPGTIPIQKFGSDTFYVQNNGHSVTVNFAPVRKLIIVSSPHRYTELKSFHDRLGTTQEYFQVMA